MKNQSFIILMIMFLLLFYSVNGMSRIITLEQEAARLFNEAFKMEDIIRSLPERYKETVIDGKPYLTMNPKVNTLEKLKAYLERIYTKKTAADYITNLDVAIINKKTGEIGRMGIYFYQKYIAFEKESTSAKVIQDSDHEKRFKITAPLCCNGNEGSFETFNNFVLKQEDGKWKVVTLPDNMR